MKTTTLEQPVTVATKPAIQIIESTTKAGKKCLVIDTDLRLSIEDFKTLMADIQLAGGYGFTKFFPELGKRSLIAAVTIDEPTFNALILQYDWKQPEPKAPKAPKGKGASKGAKKSRETHNTNNSNTIDPSMVEMFSKFQAFLSANK